MDFEIYCDVCERNNEECACTISLTVTATNGPNAGTSYSMTMPMGGDGYLVNLGVLVNCARWDGATTFSLTETGE